MHLMQSTINDHAVIKMRSIVKDPAFNAVNNPAINAFNECGQQESDKEPIAEVVMDDAVNTTGKDVVRDDDQPQDTSEPKTDKTLNQDWFQNNTKLPTPDPKWNKHQVVLDQPEQPWIN
ncbi:hypothetical protein Tco_0865470 [Tanacetum coccineum]